MGQLDAAIAAYRQALALDSSDDALQNNLGYAYFQLGEIDEAILYGAHPVIEALRNPRRRFRKLLATENALKRLSEEIG